MSRACPECGHRQDSGDRCGGCNYDGMLDLANAQHVELLRDIDRRRRDKHADRVRMVSVALAMVVVGALWLVPGYWSVRGRWYPGLPLLADQFALMIALAYATSKLLERTAPRPKFPYIEPE